MSDLTDEPRRSDLDTADEPEPDWADAIRRGRRERGERLRRVLGEPERERRPEERERRPEERERR